MENKTMMQYFEWYLPANQLLWKKCKAQAKSLKQSGIDMVWLPPAYKGADGAKSVGYDVYDTYDLGEFNQKGAIPTKYGTKEEYLQAIKALQDEKIEVLADIVLNHKMGADESEVVYAKEQQAQDRNINTTKFKQIIAWTKYNFLNRNN
jgi:alpha-amylase